MTDRPRKKPQASAGRRISADDKRMDLSILSESTKGILLDNILQVKKVVNGYYDAMKEKAEQLGLNKFLIPDTDDQQKGLVAALTVAAERQKEKQLIAKAMKISVATINKYLKYLELPGKHDATMMVIPGGRPRKYPTEVDVSFIKWASDETTPLNEKTMDGLMDKYIRLWQEKQPGFSDVTLNGLRQHIYYLMKVLDWCMIKPGTIELLRCAIHDSMVKWFADPEVREVMTGVNPLLLFNADETQITSNKKMVKKVLWTDKKRKNDALVPAGERINNHLTLFIAISATGSVMKPSVLIHEQPKKDFSPLPTKDIVCYHSKNGYMEQELFFIIMRDVFVEYVERIRRENGLVGRRAVLVVDGHISRFTERTVNLLKEHNIECVILPSHSSHVCQPLDLGLNGWFKQKFRDALHRVRPIIPFEKQRSVGRPSKTRTKQEDLSESQYADLMRAQNTSMLRAVDETPEETEERVGSAPYRRAKIVAAVIEGISALSPSKIQNAWKTSHLYPFQDGPNYTREKEERLLQQIPKADRDLLLSRAKEAEGLEAQAKGSENTKSDTKARKRSRTPEVSERRKRSRMSENTAGLENADTVTSNRKKKRGGRTGPNLFKGVLTSTKGQAWLHDFEHNREKYNVTPSTVTVQAQQGSVLVVDSTPECDTEVADPSSFFTVLKRDASTIFRAEGDVFIS